MKNLYQLNKSQRTIFIGDLHGCYDELKMLLQTLVIQEHDMVYFVGDYINKGPKSFKILKFIYKNSTQYKGVLGNHDYYFLYKIENNVKLTKEEKKLYKKLKEHPEILIFFKTMPFFIEKDNFLLIHGGIIPGKAPQEHTGEEITNLRMYQGRPWYDYYNGTKKIIYGHWAVQGIHIGKNVVGLDSSCCYGGFLSAYILETGELFQQGALDSYAHMDYSNFKHSS